VEGKEQKMDEKYVDPVCGMEVTPETAADSIEYEGHTYYFDSAGCRAAFEAAPERYVRPASETST
jgi:YHS domain-containing protein